MKRFPMGNTNTGDFGNENVDLVRDVSKLDLPKAVILGNHDCWETVSPFAPHTPVSYSGLLNSQLFLGLSRHVLNLVPVS